MPIDTKLHPKRAIDKDDIWYVWPDGTMCLEEDVDHYLTFMSDDCERVHVLTYSDDGSPLIWERL